MLIREPTLCVLAGAGSSLERVKPGHIYWGARHHAPSDKGAFQPGVATIAFQ